MTYAAHSADFQRRAASRGRLSDAAPPASLLRRLFDAIFESRERQTAREIEAFLARRGDRLSDSVERELNERFFGGGWNTRR